MSTRKDASRLATARRRLGRGLDSLLSAPAPVAPPRDPQTPPPAGRDPATVGPPPDPGGDGTPAVAMVATDQIHANPRQPRQRFDEDALQSLAASIKVAGVMQPIVLRPDPAGGYQLVVGERRWRASQRVGLSHLPAVIRHMDDRTATEWALIENIQREDLNPIERAQGLRQLTDEYGLTHQQVADHVGLDRSSVSNLLRLHELDEFTRDAVRAGRLGLGHAKALLAIANIDVRRRLAERAIRESWSVRRLEQGAGAQRSAQSSGGGMTASAGAAQAQVEVMQRRLSEHLGTKVLIRPGRTKGSGKVMIEFYTLDQFDGLMQRLGLGVGQT